MMRLALALLLALFSIAHSIVPAVAQAEKPLPGADVSGTWNGQWSSPSGFLFTATLTLKVEPDGRASGNFAWVLRRSPRPEEQAKLGKGGVEYVSGHADTAARTVTLAGTSKDDPDHVLGLDRYRLVLSDDGHVLGGISENHGSWLGQIVLTRQ
jgi:hypothetical protein